MTKDSGIHCQGPGNGIFKIQNSKFWFEKSDTNYKTGILDS